MKQLKIILLSLTAFFAIVLMSGCKKFLDRQPLTASLDDLHQGGVQGQIFGLYGAIRNPDVSGQAFNGIAWLCMNAMRSDDQEEIAESNNVHGMIDKFGYLKDDWEDGVYWDQHYALIGLANTALQTIDSLALTDLPSLQNKAEAKWFRALAYFDLVRVYGQVPKINFRVYNAAQANVPKVANISEIYALIDEDLSYAEQYLPINWNASTGTSQYPGRLTKGAAWTLHAKTLLYRNLYTQALGLCKNVMDSHEYDLTTNYWSIWKTSGENNIESIFEIQNYVSPGQADLHGGYGDYGSFWGTSQGIRGSGAWDLGWGWNTPTDSLVNAYDVGDLRKNATILFSGQPDDAPNGGYGLNIPPAASLNANNVNYWNKKCYIDPVEKLNAGSSRLAGFVNMRLLRYADVLLMAAEASNESPGAAADSVNIKGWVNAIRNRAGLPSISYISQSAMRTAIKQERRVEFGMEGERFFDLQRWGDAATVLAPLGYTEPKHKYFPLPQATVDKSNGVLIQNPNW
ncbi:MAG: RagB/SusD family nutrient uptake outer membrane protein [Sphingobacteriales bacterium]